MSLGRRRLRGEEAMPAYEFKGRRRDGTLVDLEASVSTAAVAGKTYIITSVRDIRERKRAEERLAEQASLAALDAEVGAALIQSDDLRDMLRHCAEAMVRNLDAAFARIWTLNDAEQVLELQASAGMYTHLDGPHSRVPVGQLKIGLIARERAPHLTNDVPSDPRVSDKEWAEREGVTAFAGYPLVVEGRLVGVMAMFARRPLTEVTLRAMASAANGIAMGISRKRASEELRREKEFSESLINSSIDGIIAFDHEYRYTVWNPGMERITGIKREEALGRCAFDLFPFLKEIGEDKYFSAALEGRSVVAKDRRYTVPQTGQEGFFEGHYSPLHDESGEIVGGLATIMDVTRRKQMELALRESEGKYRMLMEEASDGIHTYDMQGNFIEANSKLCEMLGYTREELLRLNVKDLVTAADLAADPIRFDELRAGGTLLSERRLLRKDGTLLPVEISSKMIQDGVLQAIIRDVTARKRAEEALRRAHDELELKVAERTADLTDINEALQAEARARGRAEEARSRLLRQIVTAQEEERHRVARELHDETGQYLTALMLELKSLESSSEGRSSTIKSVKKLQGLTDQLAVTVHHLAWELRPTALDDFGLQTALWNYAEQWSEACRIPVNFRSIGLDGERLPTHIETTIYRVAQEALNNVLKHAQAHGVSLILIRDPNDVVAVVEDDGRGFDVAAVTNKPAGEGGLGLLGMKERVVLAGGTISIESAPGQGTAILVRIPLTPAGTEKTDRE